MLARLPENLGFLEITESEPVLSGYWNRLCASAAAAVCMLTSLCLHEGD